MNNFQLLRAKHIIERLKDKMGYNIIHKILIFRVEEMLLDSCKRKNRLVKFLHYNNYYKCDHFRSLLLKSATHHVHFWQHSRKQDIVPQKLRAMGDRMIDFEDQVVKQYADIEPKCTTVSLMFASYLFEVGRNRKDAKKMLEGMAFNE